MDSSNRIIITSKQLPRIITKKLGKIASAAIEAASTKKELVRFLYVTCFYQVKNTWVKEIKNGNHIKFPGLTASLVNQHLPSEIPTTQGRQHLKYIWDNIYHS